MCICLHLNWLGEKKKRKSLRFGGSTSLVVIVVMWKSHLKWKCISFVIFHQIYTKLPVGKLFSFSRWFCKYPTVACTSCSRVRGRKRFQFGRNMIWTFNSNYFSDLCRKFGFLGGVMNWWLQLGLRFSSHQGVCEVIQRGVGLWLMAMHRDQSVSLVCDWTHINDITVLRSLQFGIFNFFFCCHSKSWFLLFVYKWMMILVH